MNIYLWFLRKFFPAKYQAWLQRQCCNAVQYRHFGEKYGEDKPLIIGWPGLKPEHMTLYHRSINIREANGKLNSGGKTHKECANQSRREAMLLSSRIMATGRKD